RSGGTISEQRRHCNQAWRIERFVCGTQTAHSGNRASGHRHGRSTYAPGGRGRGAWLCHASRFSTLLRADAANASRRRVSELGIGGFAAGSFSKGGFRGAQPWRSEERRVGKECRFRGATCWWKKRI